MHIESSNVVEAIGLGRTYPNSSNRLPTLDGVSLSVEPGEVLAIMGPSGSGKSTLLYILAGLDRPDAGVVRLKGTDWQSLKGAARAQFRRRNCGFIAQGLSLLSQATAAENIEVPLLLDGIAIAERCRRVTEALEQVGLTAHAVQLPDQLSGGEQQRVAIARALVLNPAVVLADEPTGSLDSVNGQVIARLLVSAALERKSAVIIVTHDPAIARYAHRTVTMHSGYLK